jgi:hypothetical protein
LVPARSLNGWCDVTGMLGDHPVDFGVVVFAVAPPVRERRRAVDVA